MYNFTDDSCNSLHIESTWRDHISVVDSSCQTSAENAYETANSNCQTGENTVSIEKVVKTKDDTASLMAFCKGRLKKYDEATWKGLLDQGTVTIDAEIVSNPGVRVRAGSTIAYVDCRREASCQTAGPERPGAGAASSSGDGGEEEFKDGGDDACSAPELADFLAKVSPSVFRELESNISSKSLFEEYHALGSAGLGFDPASGPGGGGMGGNSYWKTLSVDLEKLKIVYPDWSAASADFFSAKIVRIDRTRVGDRVYDLELLDNDASSGSGNGASRIASVREEYLRVHSNHASQSGAGKGAGAGPLAAGIRVFATAGGHEEGKDSRGKRSSGTSDGNRTYFLPGTIDKCYRGTYDIRLNNGKLLEGCAAGDIISTGLALEQIVETRRPVLPRLQCTGCAWNNTGSSLAASYGIVNIQGWCNAPGCVAIWNLFSRRFDPTQPTYILDHSSALTVVRFHPEIPSLVVAGSATGEIIVWDLNTAGPSSSSTSSVPTSVDPVHVSPISEFSHKEPVMDIQWVSSGANTGIGGASGRFFVSSVSADGKLLFWSLNNKLKYPVKGYLLTPQGGGKSKGPYPSAHGGVCLSTMEQGSGSTAKAKWLLVGQEGGHIMRSQVAKLLPSGGSNNVALLTNESFKNASYAEDVYTSINKGGADRGGVFYYENHVGNVNAIDTSPFHRSLFVSVGNDGDIHLYNLLERKPLRCFESLNAKSKVLSNSNNHSLNGNNMNCSYANVTSVQFSPLKPTVFATSSMNGFVAIYDLTSPTASPIYQFDVQSDFSRHRKGEDGNTAAAFGSGAGITNISFNSARKNLFAACDSNGNIHVYKLNRFLSNQNLQNSNQTQLDVDYLNQLGNRNN